MGEYLPPPFGLIQLASYLEKRVPETEIEVIDCNAEKLDWAGLEKRIEALEPDIVGVSSMDTSPQEQSRQLRKLTPIS